MSKADQLGAGRFGGGTRPVSARRAAIGAVTGVPTEGVAPPTRLPISQISPNPDNPRTTTGDLAELAGSLKEHGQKAAITVMNRDAYIRANPTRAGDLEPDATHVVVDGSSRLAAAHEAGITHLNVMVDDEQGSDGDSILESALVANVHRNDLDPMDEARALQRLLAIHGSQVKLAKRLRKSQGWVSQRLALLNLTPELQAAVGEEPVEFLRSVAKLPQDRQEETLHELKAERARKDADRQASASASTPASPTASAPAPEPASAPAAAPAHLSVAAPPSPEPEPESAPQPKSVAEPSKSVPAPPAGSPSSERAEISVPPTRKSKREAAPPSSAVRPEIPAANKAEPHEPPAAPDQGASQSQTRVVRQLPYDDGTYIAMHLIKKMDDTEFDQMLAILNKHQSERLASQGTTH